MTPPLDAGSLELPNLAAIGQYLGTLGSNNNTNNTRNRFCTTREFGLSSVVVRLNIGRCLVRKKNKCLAYRPTRQHCQTVGYLSPIFQTHFRNLGMAGWIPHFQEHGNGKIMSITGIAVMQFSDPFPLPVGRYRQLFKDRLDPHGRPVPWPKPWPWWPWIEESSPPGGVFWGDVYDCLFSCIMVSEESWKHVYYTVYTVYFIF